MPRKARVEGAAAEPERDEAGKRPKDHAHHLEDAYEAFQQIDPEGWEELRLCPLQHGIETMVRKLRAR